MRLRSWRRVVAIGLAIWFAWLSAFVHVLHSRVEAQCRGIAAEYEHGVQSANAMRDPPDLDRPSQGDEPPARVPGLCPICLFLKHTAPSPCDPPTATPNDRMVGLADPDWYIFVSSLDQPTVNPRAPPADRPL
jgi:hypothetical protein